MPISRRSRITWPSTRDWGGHLRNRFAPRVAGAFDSFEVAVRAILGQQVSVAAATRLAERLAVRCARSPDPWRDDGLTFLFPRPRDILRADLSAMGMPGARVRSILHLSEAAEADACTARPERRLRKGRGASQGPARHRRVDRAVHRPAGMGTPRRLSRKRHRTAPGDERRRGAAERRRAHGNRRSMAPLPRPCRDAPVEPSRRHERLRFRPEGHFVPEQATARRSANTLRHRHHPALPGRHAVGDNATPPATHAPRRPLPGAPTSLLRNGDRE